MIPYLYFHPKAETAATGMSDHEIANLVLRIVSSLGTDQRAFQHSSDEYNSDFFKDEPREFQVALCTALLNHFQGHSNHYWAKNSSNSKG